jgi:hypothetical protein
LLRSFPCLAAMSKALRPFGPLVRASRSRKSGLPGQQSRQIGGRGAEGVVKPAGKPDHEIVNPGRAGRRRID